MEINEILTKAYMEVEKSEIPDDYRLKAFEKCIDLIVGLQYASTKQRVPSLSSKETNRGIYGDNNSIVNNISKKLNIDPLILEEVYYVEDDELKVILGSTKLDGTNAGATKEIALLIAGGRQLGNIEDWTTAELIREECEYFNKYDPSNYAKTIRSMDNVFSFVGSGQKRKVKINRLGKEKLEKLIKDVIGQNDN